MRNRYYDPGTRQFTQPDPIGIAGGLNVYGFAAGDPVSYSDPYGLCPACVAAYADFEAAANLYDLYDLGKTAVNYLRGRASGRTLGITAAGTAVGLFSFGGGYGNAARNVVGWSGWVGSVPPLAVRLEPWG